MKLSCIESTAPSEDAVLTVANSADWPGPKRTSLPSMLPPACCAPGAWSMLNPASAWFGVVSPV